MADLRSAQTRQTRSNFSAAAPARGAPQSARGRLVERNAPASGAHVQVSPETGSVRWRICGQARLANPIRAAGSSSLPGRRSRRNHQDGCRHQVSPVPAGRAPPPGYSSGWTRTKREPAWRRTPPKSPGLPVAGSHRGAEPEQHGHHHHPSPVLASQAPGRRDRPQMYLQKLGPSRHIRTSATQNGHACVRRLSGINRAPGRTAAGLGRPRRLRTARPFAP